MSNKNIDASKLLILQELATKYSFGFKNYLLLHDETLEEQPYPVENAKQIEAFKRFSLLEKPSAKYWSILNENEVEEFFKLNKNKDKNIFIENKIKHLDGNPKKIFSKLIISILELSAKNSFNTKKTLAILTVFCRTHQYFLYNIWTTPEELYNFFKNYLYYHSIDLPPVNIKVLTIYDCKKVLDHFCKIYLRNMPIIKLTVMPNYGILLNYNVPHYDIPDVGKKKKKKKKK